MKFILSIVVCFSILAAPRAALSCPMSVICPIDQQPMYQGARAKDVAGHHYTIFEHSVFDDNSKKVAHHEQWVECR
jgi:hypothetical protein